MVRRRARARAAALAALLSSGLAAAQEGAPPAATAVAPAVAEERGGEVVVTGSRIPRERDASASPVLLFGRDEILASGKVTVGEFLRALPQQGNAVGAGVNVGGDGSTRVNLRGIGATRTLVLVNGRRWVPGGTGARGAVDLDTIPTSAIERIEVLTGGASAVHGSEAIAGVVNLVTRTAVDARELSLLAGTSQEGDGTAYDVNATVGTAGDRGSVLFTAGYHRRQRTMATDRDWARVPVGLDATTDREFTLGSDTGPAARILLADGVAWDPFTGSFMPDPLTPGTRGVTDPSASALYSDLVSVCPTANDPYVVVTNPDGSTSLGSAAGTRLACPSSYLLDTSGGAVNPAYAAVGWRPYRGTALPEEGGDAYNFRVEDELVTPGERVQLFAAGDARLGSVARGFLEASYVRRQSSQGRASEALSTDVEGIVVSGRNAYNPFGRDVTALRRRLVELGQHTTRQELDTFRVVVGLDGATPPTFGPLAGWSWDIALVHGRNDGTEAREGWLRRPALQDALGPSFLRTDGTFGCGLSAGSEIPGCVPLDLFHAPGSITPDQASAITAPLTARVLDRMTSVQAHAGGALFAIPTAGRPARLALGVEWRELAGEYLADPAGAGGLVTGPPVTSTDGRYDAREAYAELSLPIVSAHPGADDLEATIAARAFDYSTFGGDWSWGLGARWRPVAGMTVRGTYATAYRAPTIVESFGARAEDLQVLEDPCALPANGAIAANCGLAAWNGDDATLFRSIVGGNPEVGPETATVATLGAVLAPPALPDLSVAVGYYAMEIDGLVGSTGAAVLVMGCYTGAHPESCSHVVRDPATRQIDLVYDLNANVGKLATSGVDLAIRYALPTPRLGRFSLALGATWLRRLDLTLPDGTVFEGKGTFDASLDDGGAGAAFPAWKATAGVTWTKGGLGAGLSTRYVGSLRECGELGFFAGGGACHVDATSERDIEAYHVEDAFVAYAFGTAAGRTSVMLAVQNLLDRDPPRIYSGAEAATDTSTYDLLGRFFQVRLAHAY